MSEQESFAEVTATPMFKKMFADASHMERDLSDFNKRYGDLVRSDTSGMSVILRSHLIVEHFIDQYLPKAHPGVRDWDAARLTFSQKLAFIDHPQSNLEMVMPGIRALNRARNKVAHTLDAAFPPRDLKPIEDFMRIWYGAAGKPIPTGMDAVIHFALTVAAFLHGSTRMIERHCPGGGVLGLVQWHRD